MPYCEIAPPVPALPVAACQTINCVRFTAHRAAGSPWQMAFPLPSPSYGYRTDVSVIDQRRPTNAAAAVQEAPIGWTFFRQWLKNPLAIAALSPSSRRLARAMISQLPVGARRIVELGGGTGVFTRALLDHGVVPSDLLVIELNKELHKLLARRFPEVHVERGDARDLQAVIRNSGFAHGPPVDAIISGLGLLSMTRTVQRAILEAAFSVLGPDGRFIQFTYGPVSPVARDLLSDIGLSFRRASVAWLNVPPATVYVFTRNKSRGIHAVRAEPRI